MFHQYDKGRMTKVYFESTDVFSEDWMNQRIAQHHAWISPQNKWIQVANVQMLFTVRFMTLAQVSQNHYLLTRKLQNCQSTSNDVTLSAIIQHF